MDPLRRRPVDPSDRRSVAVANGQQDRGRELATLGLERFEGRERRVLAGLDLRLLGLLPALGPRRPRLGEVVGEDRAERRIGGDVVGVAVVGRAVAGEGGALDLPPGLARGEEERSAREVLLGDVAQRRVVVEDVEAAAEVGRDQVVLAALDGEVSAGALAVEDRFPGGAGVDRLPDAARADRDVPGVRVRGVDGDVGDASGLEGRSDPAQLEAAERRRREAGFLLHFRLRVLRFRGERRQGGGEPEDENDSVAERRGGTQDGALPPRSWSWTRRTVDRGTDAPG